MARNAVISDEKAARHGGLRRVLVFAGDLRLGGAEKQLVALARGLVRAGVEMDVCVYERGHHYDDALAATGARLLDGPSRTDPPSRVAHAIKLARNVRPDLVLSWRFYLNIYVALAARAIGVAGIGAMREDIEDAFAGVGRLGAPCLRLPDAILTNSQRAALAIEQRGATARYLGNVIDIAAFDQAAAQPVHPVLEPTTRPRILAVGTLKPEKAYDVLLDALRLLLDDGSPQPLLAIAGDGALRDSLQAQAGRLQLGAQDLCLLGSRNDIAALLRNTDIAVLSSRQEGTPNAVLEAMAAQCPIVTTDVGDAGLLIDDGRSGLVVPPDDPKELAAALRTLLDDPETAARYAEQARAAVRAYDTTQLGERAIDVLAPFCEPGRAIRTRVPKGGRRVWHRRNT